ncbi:MAG: Fe-S cluster assembly protein SufB [Pseudomonadales bacterium]|nr:Fe-S cluster assembly protein SufB [Pseudomonadales bacterium]
MSKYRDLNSDLVARVSARKNEPTWMLEIRQQALETFFELGLPTWGPNLSNLDFSEINYYIEPESEVKHTWEEVPEKIKQTFEKLGLPEQEAKFFSGVADQFESTMAYNHLDDDLKKQGAIFLDTDSALQQHPEIFKKYFSSLIPATDNKFAALNTALWSGGAFVYIPKGVVLEQPLQSYFRMESRGMGQFERTLIIVEDNGNLDYLEGCTAPLYSKNSLHCGVVEIFVGENARCRYSTVQNWSENVYNLVTKRAICQKNAQMSWVDGNIGSAVTMKYPAVILSGEGATGSMLSISTAGVNQDQDSGAKMIHLASNTSSSIMSKSIAHDGGIATYRGLVKISKDVKNCRAQINCDNLILDNKSVVNSFPENYSIGTTNILENEASISRVNDAQLLYLQSRGLSKEDAYNLIVLGFVDDFLQALPMEYSIELQQLLKMELVD